MVKNTVNTLFDICNISRTFLKNAQNSLKRFVAFTLAETLIVMGIIGIVSALTLPNLNSSTGEKEKVAKVKKIYQNLDDAIGRATAVYGPVNEWFINDASYTAQITRFGDRVTEFMKVSKNCGVSTNQRCFSNTKAKPIEGDDGSFKDYDTVNTSYKFQLADGTSVAFGDITWAQNINDYIYIFFNIDGPKGKNVSGVDVFGVRLDVTKGQIEVAALPFISGLFSSNNGLYQTFWVMQYDNMDYLKADKNGKCSSGKVLNITANPPVISCK